MEEYRKEAEKRAKEEQKRREEEAALQAARAATEKPPQLLSAKVPPTEESKDQAASNSPVERTGDPFKDFEIDLKKMETDAEAVKYVKIGREATYSFIDLLYRTDWHFEKKTSEGIKLFSLRDNPGEPDYARFETKFGQVTVTELSAYFSDIDKRIAWQNNIYASLEQVRAFPLQTSMHYGKLLLKKGQPEKDSLLVTQGVEVKGNRRYLVSVSVDHDEYPPQQKVKRTKQVIHANYFEPTADGRGVKHILITRMVETTSEELARSFGKQGTNETHLQSIVNLKNLLKGTRVTSAPTTYLARTALDAEASLETTAAAATPVEISAEDTKTESQDAIEGPQEPVTIEGDSNTERADAAATAAGEDQKKSKKKNKKK